MNSFTTLKVPSQYGGCPFVQTTDPVTFALCFRLVREKFPKVSTRNEIRLGDSIVSAELHQLGGRDGEAAMTILKGLLEKGYEITRTDISQSEHGTQVVAVVYNLIYQTPEPR